MIFDGHGGHQPDDPAVLMLKDEPVDVWSLRDRGVRVPPIVVLSACDTHAADRNHATTANGLLALGARAVLASVFPLDAATAAIFAGRLVFRVAAFVPAAVGLLGRGLSWTEVVSGMLRMQLITEFLRNMEHKRLIDREEYFAIHKNANFAINGGAPDPFADVLVDLVRRGTDEAVARRELRLTIASSSPVSYIHLGRPETIVLDTPEHRAALVAAPG